MSDLIIIAANQLCEVGEVMEGTYRLTVDVDVEMCFKVVRMATYEEWVEYRRVNGRELPGPQSRRGYYYAAITD